MDQNKPSMLVPAAIGGAFLGVTSAFPILGALNCACCMLVIAGGVIASYFYIRNYPNYLPPVSYGEGALLGLFTGLIGAAVWIAVSIPMQLLTAHFFSSGMGMPSDVLDDPDIPPALRAWIERMMASGGFTIVATAVWAITTSLIFATVGGIIGVALFGKRTQLPPPPIPPGGPVRYDYPPPTVPPATPPPSGPTEPPPSGPINI